MTLMTKTFRQKKILSKTFFEKKIELFSSKFPRCFSPKFWNFHFSNWLFEEKIENFWSRKIFSRDQKFSKKKKHLRKVNWKNENCKISKIFRENFDEKRSGFVFEKLFRQEKIIFLTKLFLSSKSWLVLPNYQFSASNSIYKIPKTQQQKKFYRNCRYSQVFAPT